MEDLTNPDHRHHLRYAQGWIELGNFDEANAELAKVPFSSPLQSKALHLRWLMLSAAGQWDLALEVAKTVCRLDPEDEEARILLAYTLDQVGKTRSAIAALLLAYRRLKHSPRIAYNIACYRDRCYAPNRVEAEDSFDENAWEGFLKDLGFDLGPSDM